MLHKIQILTDNLQVVKSFVKNSVGLLVAVGICGGITVVSSLGMFSKIEKNFYEPARLSAIRTKLDAVAEYSNEYINNILKKIGPDEGGFLANEAASSYFEREPSREVGRLFGKLLDELPSLEGLRVVERTGKRVQYSSFKNDSRNERGNKTYSLYTELKTYSGASELDYSIVTAFPETEDEENDIDLNRYRMVFDGYEQRIIISYPYFYNEKSYSFIFYINPIDFVTQLVENRIISINDEMTLISSKDGTAGGFVFRMPRVGQSILANEILRRWYLKSTGPDEIASSPKVQVSGLTADENSAEEQIIEERRISWNLITSPKSKYFNVSGLYSYEMLTMPQYVKILLLICSFITVCLIVIILFNIRKDDDVVILSKIKSVQIGLLNEFFEKNVDRTKVAALIESQKDALTAKIKKSLGRRGKRYGDDLSIILNQSWQDIINILSGENTMSIQNLSSNDMSEIRRMFEDVMSNSSIRVQAVTQFPSRQMPKNWKTEELDNSAGIEIAPRPGHVTEKPADEISELDDAEDLEELGEVDEIAEAEPVEELGEVEEVAEAEPVEELGEVEEISEAEPVEELDDVEEVAEAEPVEELGEVEEISEAEPVEELDEVEEIPEAETVEESAKDLNELGETADITSVEELVDEEDLKSFEKEYENITNTVNAYAEKTEDNSSEEPVSDGEIETLEYAEEGEESSIPVEDCKESIVYSSPRSEVSQFEGTESLKIGDTVKANEDGQIDNSVVDNFVVYNALNIFDSLTSDTSSITGENQEASDETELKKNDSDEDSMSDIKKKQTDDVVELESVSRKSEDFMFTTFAANDNNVTELSPDAIVQGDDGVFSIANDVSTAGIAIDEDFKKLVDSVLR